MKLFNRHHIRSVFYHIVAVVFVISTGLWYFDILSDKASYIITAILFIADYIAEMYDPHPDTPGPWFRRHFHRAFDSEDNDGCEVTKFYNEFKKEYLELENDKTE